MIPDGLPVVEHKARILPSLRFIPQQVNPVSRRIGAFEKDRLGIVSDLRLPQFNPFPPEDAHGQLEIGDPDGDVRL